MGTRHLIAVIQDGTHKVAQYGQWDGYPSGQGERVLSFLKGFQHVTGLDPFREAVRKCSYLTEEDIAEINKDYQPKGKHRHLSRDAGSDILEYVLTAPDGLKLQDQIGFAGDSLFCEWAYVIDLDNNEFEVYKGFNKESTPADSRFPSGAEWLEKTDGYEPVSLAGKWSFDDLPGQVEFENTLEPTGDEEE